jgi:hypothetical protein
MPNNPRQMFTHALNALAGWWDEHALDLRGRIHSQVVATLYAGSVVHVAALDQPIPAVNPDTAAFAGLPVPLVKPGTPTGKMGIFIRQNADDFDVVNDGGDDFVWLGVVPPPRQVGGHVSGLVATGGYELETTEYVGSDAPDGSVSVYTPNTKLYGEDTNVAGQVSGRLTTDGTGRSVCGVVSHGVYKNYNGVFVLAFWPVYIG